MKDGKNHAIKATDEWYDALQAMPFKSSKYYSTILFTRFIIIGKNGKTLHLLKQTAKKTQKRKKRTVIPLLGSLSKYNEALAL